MEFKFMMTVRKQVECHKHVNFKVAHRDVINRLQLNETDAKNWKDFVPDYLEQFKEPFDPEAELAKYRNEIENMSLIEMVESHPSKTSLIHFDHKIPSADWDIRELDAGRLSHS